MQNFLLQVSGLTPARTATILPVVMGLISVIIGWVALARTRSSRFKAIVALLLGVSGAVISGLLLARATGGFGTGSGRLGAIVALTLGLTGTVLSALALARMRRTGLGSSTTATGNSSKEN